MSAAVKSIEDHGYILSTGLSVSAFLKFKDAKLALPKGQKLAVGQVIDVSILSMSENGRTCTVTIDTEVLKSASVRWFSISFGSNDIDTPYNRSRNYQMSTQYSQAQSSKV